MSPHTLRIFGSVFLIVALISSATLFGTSESFPSSTTSSLRSSIQTKSLSNIVFSNQLSYSKLLNGYQNPPELDPVITTRIMGGRPLLNITETGLPDGYAPLDSYCGPGKRC